MLPIWFVTHTERLDKLTIRQLKFTPTKANWYFGLSSCCVFITFITKATSALVNLFEAISFQMENLRRYG